MLATLPRLDREGPALARELVKAAERLPWSEIAWLLDQGPLEFTMPSERGERQVRLTAKWHRAPWQSPTLITVRVDARVKGRSLPAALGHRDYGAHELSDLPATPPEPTPVDRARLLSSLTH